MRRRALVAVGVALVLVACGSNAGEPSGRPPTSTSASSGAQSTGAVPKLKLTPIATGGAFTAAAVRSGDGDLYLAEQDGRVRRLRLSGGKGTLDVGSVLDISSSVTAGGEQGLLGIAFSPDGNELFVAFTNKDENQQVDRFRFDGNNADASSRSTVITIEDFAPNHNGGGLLFGPDDYLYYSMGDGGGGGDPRGNGQKTTDLLGNILRIDPLRASGGKPYAIPSDNPFADGKGGAPEVYVYGLRNPWRFSFDRSTDDMWIADVGQNEWEEIDRLPAGKIAGANLGWSVFEGTHKFGDAAAPANAVPPVYEYDHSGGRCSVTGGYVYRGDKIPDLVGVYLFVDYCGGAMQGVRIGSDGKTAVLDLSISVVQTSSFAEDANGELYAVSTDGTVARIDAA